MEIAALLPQLAPRHEPVVPTLSEAERAPPVVVQRGPARWLRHETLGFEMRLPDGLEPVVDDADMRAAASRMSPTTARAIAAWRWRDAGVRRDVCRRGTGRIDMRGYAHRTHFYALTTFELHGATSQGEPFVDAPHVWR